MQLQFTIFLKNWPSPASFIVYFRSFQTNITILQQYMWKNVHPASGTGIEPMTSWTWVSSHYHKTRASTINNFTEYQYNVDHIPTYCRKWLRLVIKELIREKKNQKWILQYRQMLRQIKYERFFSIWIRSRNLLELQFLGLFEQPYE